MDDLVLLTILLGVLLIAGVSARVRNTIITLPMLYTLFGLGVSFLLADRSLSVDAQVVNVIGTLTLVLLLASDASRIVFGNVMKHHDLPLRLLGIGLPLTIALGTVITAVMFGGMGIWTAAILAVILAPTDASLGSSVVDNKKVPARIRQALNIESGLNDGIAMPFLLLFIAMAAATGRLGSGAFVTTLLGQIGFGVLVGAGLGYFGAKYLVLAVKRGWMSPLFQKIAWLALVVLVYVLAELVGGNGYIAAFSFGIVAGNTMAAASSLPLYEFGKTEYTLLMMVTYIFFGMILLPQALANISLTYILYAALSLTVVRMLPVAISLLGARLQMISTLFIGWFGPRGIASILYVIYVSNASGIGSIDVIFNAAMLTVFLSIMLHGMSAAPLSNWYGDRMAARASQGAADVEQKPVPDVATRANSV